MLKAAPTSRTKSVLAHALAGSLILATAGVVWASQPVRQADAEAPALPDYAAFLQLNIDGQSTGPILGFSERSDFVVESAGWRISGDYQPDRSAEDLILRVSYKDQPVTTQRFEINLGDPFNVTATAGQPSSQLSLNGHLEKFDPSLTQLQDGKSATYRRLTPPRYPKEAADAGVSGWVVIRALIGKDGVVKQAEIEKSSPSGVFDETSLETVKGWTFNPPTRDGEAISEWVQVPICFTLEEAQQCEVPKTVLDAITLRPNKPTT